MNLPAASLQSVRRVPWALWTTLLAMLLALQASAGAIRPAALAETGAIAAKLTLPAPLAAQFRDTGQALKATAQRLGAAKPQDRDDGTPPPIPELAAIVSASALSAGFRHSLAGVAPSGASPSSAYRARAPPLPA